MGRGVGAVRGGQFTQQLRKAWILLIRNKSSFLLMLLFPAIAAVLTVVVAGENMFVTYGGTRSACFFMMCAALWGGLFNSVQLVVNQKDITHSDLRSDMSPAAFVLGNAVVQLALCAFQSLILTASLWGIVWKYGNDLPDKGLVFANTYVEFYVSLFLLFFASDMMGLVVSCLAKKPETASVFTPYILIAELILSGVLFKLSGAMDKISNVMLSRWGMEALGSTSNLNDIPTSVKQPVLPHEAEDMYSYTSGHLLKAWLILLVFAFVFLALSYVLVGHKDTKDHR